MSALDQLHDQLVAANTRLADQRAADTSASTAAPTGRRPRRTRRVVIAVCGLAVLTGGVSAATLATTGREGSSAVASILPGPVRAMADQLARREGILHVVSGETMTRTGDGPWKLLFDPKLHDEAWVALDGSGWRDRVVDETGAIAHDGRQRADGSEQVMRRDSTVRTTPAPTEQTPESRLPRQAWGRFVGAQLMRIGELRRVGEETLDGHRVVIVVDQGLALESDKMDYRYAFDEQTGALRQVRQRLLTRDGWTEDRTDIAAWQVRPDTPELRQTLTTLRPLTSRRR